MNNSSIVNGVNPGNVPSSNEDSIANIGAPSDRYRQQYQ